MEFCAGGDLAALIRRKKREMREKVAQNRSKDDLQQIYFSEGTCWRVLAQLTLALLECHRRKGKHKILHRDLKPGNVMFDGDKNVKLGDFGLSRIMGDESVFAYTHVGTPYYMSPEQIQEQRYNEKSDIWSAGCVIYEMVSLIAPFEATNQIQLAYKIKLGKINRIPEHFSEELFHVLKSMISIDPSDRPSVEQLMVHPRICFVIKQLEVKRREGDVQRKMQEFVKIEQNFQSKVALIADQKQKIEAKSLKLNTLRTQIQQRKSRLLL